MGELFLQPGKLQSHAAAAIHFQKVVERQPAIPEAWHMWSVCLVHLKKIDEALIAVNQALRLDPDYESARDLKSAIVRQMSTKANLPLGSNNDQPNEANAVDESNKIQDTIGDAAVPTDAANGATPAA